MADLKEMVTSPDCAGCIVPGRRWDPCDHAPSVVGKATRTSRMDHATAAHTPSGRYKTYHEAMSSSKAPTRLPASVHPRYVPKALSISSVARRAAMRLKYDHFPQDDRPDRRRTDR